MSGTDQPLLRPAAARGRAVFCFLPGGGAAAALKARANKEKGRRPRGPFVLFLTRYFLHDMIISLKGRRQVEKALKKPILALKSR